jgi:hypothetical protein
MRDGVRLAVDVTLPATVAPGERLPTILHQTRYWRRTRLRWPASMFVDALDAQGRLGAIERRFLAQGYAWVDVDVRGSGASFGTRSRPSGNADADSDSAPSRAAPPCTRHHAQRGGRRPTSSGSSETRRRPVGRTRREPLTCLPEVEATCEARGTSSNPWRSEHRRRSARSLFAPRG